MAAVIQRPLRGSRISTFYPVKNLPSLSSLDSAFQLQEYISLLIRLDVHDVDAIVSLPGSPKDTGHEKDDTTKEADKEGKNEVTVDEACWIYEQLRRLAQDLSHPLITTLQQECTRASCPEMKAGEWLYLCVAHGNDGAMEQCCAIDYILHTVDSATALLNSPRTFPSRLQIPQTSYRHFSSLARRLGRIFAHAYFHHREAFEQAEAESSLYARFLALTAKFDLVPAEFLVIPSSQFTGEDSGSDSDREQPGMGGYTDGRQIYPPQMREEDYQRQQNAHTPSQQQQQQRNASPPGEGSGAGDSPASASRSRIGRNRTDTMVFTDAEASVVTDELAAKAKAGELEPEEHEAPSTARPLVEVPQRTDELHVEEPEAEQFEILLKSDEIIPAVIEETTPSQAVVEPNPAPEAETRIETTPEKDVTDEPTTSVHKDETPASEPEPTPTPVPEPVPEVAPTPEAPSDHFPEVKAIDFAVEPTPAPVEPTPTTEVAETPPVAPSTGSAEPPSVPEPITSSSASLDATSTSTSTSTAATPDSNPAPAPSTEELPAATIQETKEEIPTPLDPAATESSSVATPLETELAADNGKEDIISAAVAENEVKPPASEDEIEPVAVEEEVKPLVSEEEVKPSTSEEEVKALTIPDDVSAEPPVAVEKVPLEGAQPTAKDA